MNKAFIKEADDTGGRCPKCGSLGSAVGAETLAAFVREPMLENIAKAAFFCEYARCEVVYFDAFERVVTTVDVRAAVWPKDPAAPICGCFGLTADDVAADVAEGGVGRVKSVIERSKTAEAACLTRSPTGRCCAADVQRCYFRLRGGAG
jgi:hypothetical protein